MIFVFLLKCHFNSSFELKFIFKSIMIFVGHLTAGGHFVAKNNFANSLYFPHNGLGSYQLTNTFIASPQKPNQQAFVQSSQPHAPIPPPAGLPQLPEMQPSFVSI